MRFGLPQLEAFTILALHLRPAVADSSSDSSAAESSSGDSAAESTENGVVFKDMITNSANSEQVIKKYRLMSPSSQSVMGDGRVSVTYDYRMSFYKDSNGVTTSYSGVVISNTSPEEICRTTVNAWRGRETEFATGVKETGVAGSLVYKYGVMSMGLDSVILEMRYNHDIVQGIKDRPESGDVSTEPAATSETVRE